MTGWSNFIKFRFWGHLKFWVDIKEVAREKIVLNCQLNWSALSRLILLDTALRAEAFMPHSMPPVEGDLRRFLPLGPSARVPPGVGRSRVAKLVESSLQR